MKGVNETYKYGKWRSDRTVNASSWVAVVFLVYIRTNCCQLLLQDIFCFSCLPIFAENKKKIKQEFFLWFSILHSDLQNWLFLYIRSICFWWKFILAFSDCKMLIFLFLNVLAKQELKSLFTRISTVVLHVVLFYKIWRSWADLQPTIKLLFHYCHALTLLWALFSSCYTFLLLMFWWMVSNTWSLRVATHRMLKATPSHTQSGKQGPGPVLYTTRLCDIYVICL